MRRPIECPWCHEPVVVDDRAPLGCCEARSHVRRCPVLRSGTWRVLTDKEPQTHD